MNDNLQINLQDEDETMQDIMQDHHQDSGYSIPASTLIKEILQNELEMEIALRARLLETIKGRIEWSLTLEQALLNGQALGTDDNSTFAYFQNQAIDCYDAIHVPSGLLLSRPASPPPPQSMLSRASTVELTPSLQASHGIGPVTGGGRKPPARRYLTQLTYSHLSDQKKPMYIRDVPPQAQSSITTPTSAPEIYRLTCPDCARSDLPTIQGLLNHCRIKHHRDFGSHDECVQRCATRVTDETEAQWLLENGTELVELRRSLRGLFEAAVGVEGGVGREGVGLGFGFGEGEDGQEEGGGMSTHLSKTLGHHLDTPALALFLGKQAQRRQISVFGEDDIVNVISDDVDAPGAATTTTDMAAIKTAASSTSHKQKWHMTYEPRSSASAPLAIVLSGDTDDEESNEDDRSLALLHTLPNTTGTVSSGSRFHIVARLVIADWSMRIVPGSGVAAGGSAEDTHKWLVSVHSPSYSLHSTTFLETLTVSSLTNPPPSFFSNGPVSVSEPPFCIMGTSDRPFLANVTLQWVGGKGGMEVAHWVDLDLNPHPTTTTTKSSSRKLLTAPVLGEEQILDVELDRNTPLLLRKDDVWAVDWSVKGGRRELGTGVASSNGNPGGMTGVGNGAGRLADAVGTKASEKKKEDEHLAKLKRLLQEFPMTKKDIKPRAATSSVINNSANTPHRLPYLLPNSPAHLDSMIMGRRKAVEWGRAGAIARALCSPSSAESSNVVPFTGSSTRGNIHAQPQQRAQSQRQPPFFTKSESGSGLEMPSEPKPAFSLRTPADVYRWLRTNGHFHRKVAVAAASFQSGQNKSAGTQATISTSMDSQSITSGAPAIDRKEPVRGFCSVCGFGARMHVRAGPTGDVVWCEASTPEWAFVMPRVDIKGIMRTLGFGFKKGSRNTGMRPSISTALEESRAMLGRYSSRDIMTLSDPAVTHSIHGILEATRKPSSLSSFPGSQVESEPPSSTSFYHALKYQRDSDTDFQNPDAVDSLKTSLAVSSLLAAILPSFVRRVVNAGINAMDTIPPPVRSEKVTAPSTDPRAFGPHVLTPVHVVKGLMQGFDLNQIQVNGGREHGGMALAIAMSMVRLGVVVGEGSVDDRERSDEMGEDARRLDEEEEEEEEGGVGG